MKYFLISIFFCVNLVCVGQQEFHVFPANHQINPGTETGTGSITSPWDLQTALIQLPSVVNGGDTIWLHEGIYSGRFVSTIKSTRVNSYITVSAFQNETVTLNGNIESNRQHVLEVKGQNVIYKDFEITCLGDFSRNSADSNFERINGLEHSSGTDCQFINLIVHDVPGLGVGSWKLTGGTIFDGCMVYNNGYISNKGAGVGEGFYVQNSSDKIRKITNCIIFNNYYKGVEVWSANKKAKYEYVKNFKLSNNAIFNNGAPSGHRKDNLIIGSGDRNGINVAKNIQVLNNVFYHNTDVAKAQVEGDAASLTIGFNKNALVENVVVKNNFIIGRNNGLRLLHAKSLSFQNNIAYCGYVHLGSSMNEQVSNWNFEDNKYFTKKKSAFRVINYRDFDLKKWQSAYSLDNLSSWNSIKDFNIENYSTVTRFRDGKQAYKVVIFNKEGQNSSVDFSKWDLALGSTYSIFDAENRKVKMVTGTLTEDYKVEFPVHINEFEKPLHNTIANKTLSNFGVYIIEFDAEKEVSKQSKTVFGRFFRWLGF